MVRWFYGYTVALRPWLDRTREKKLCRCPPDANDDVAMWHMKMYFRKSARLTEAQLDLDVVWERGETYGIWFFGETYARGLPNPCAVPAGLPPIKHIEIVRRLCTTEMRAPRWHLDASVYPESVLVGEERYKVILLRCLISVPYAPTAQDMTRANELLPKVQAEYDKLMETKRASMKEATAKKAAALAYHQESYARTQDFSASTETLTTSG